MGPPLSENIPPVRTLLYSSFLTKGHNPFITAYATRRHKATHKHQFERSRGKRNALVDVSSGPASVFFFRIALPAGRDQVQRSYVITRCYFSQERTVHESPSLRFHTHGSSLVHSSKAQKCTPIFRQLNTRNAAKRNTSAIRLLQLSTHCSRPCRANVAQVFATRGVKTKARQKRAPCRDPGCDTTFAARLRSEPMSRLLECGASKCTNYCDFSH